MSINSKNDALLDAVIANNAEEVKSLLDAGANPNYSEDRDNITPLHHAVANKSLKVVRHLLAAGAKLDAENHDGQTPLELARELKQDEIVKLLLVYADAGRVTVH